MPGPDETKDELRTDPAEVGRATPAPSAGRSKGASFLKKHGPLILLILFLVVMAAIAIPNLLRSRIASGESPSVPAMRTLNTAQVTFASTYNSGFTDGLNRLGSPSSGEPNVNNADLVDPVLAGRAEGGTNTSFVKSGYRYTYTPGPGKFGQITSYTITARPMAHGSTGIRSYFTDETAVIRATSEDRAATAKDPPI